MCDVSPSELPKVNMLIKGAPSAPNHSRSFEPRFQHARAPSKRHQFCVTTVLQVLQTTMGDVECYIFDFTLGAEGLSPDDIHHHLDPLCKKWIFQLERGEQATELHPEGYVHYQGRFSLIKKKREVAIAKLLKSKGMKDVHISTTSKEAADNYSRSNEAFYCMKEDTREGGPWSDQDYRLKPKLPWPYCEENWDDPLPWMKDMLKKLSVRSKRVIHCIVDPTGSCGKTSFGFYCLAQGIAFRVPPYNELNDIYGVVMAYPGQKGYIFDMPKALPKNKLQGMFSGIEEIKNGYCCDKRYHFKFKTFDSPNVLVFTNRKPNLSYLSKDRWLLYSIKNNELVDFVDEECLTTDERERDIDDDTDDERDSRGGELVVRV